MPTYEYRCDECGNEFEATQKITDDPLKSCSKCGGQIQRLIGATNFILKGNGWYKSDYGTPSSGGSEKPASCPEEKTGPQCGACPANTD